MEASMTHTKRLASAGLVVGLFGVGSVLAQTPQDRPRPESTPSAKNEIHDRHSLITKLHTINQEEIQAGKLATEKAHSLEVRQYGQKLMQDHQANDEKLKKLAGQDPEENQQTRADEKKMAWTISPELPAEKKQALERLRSLHGDELDSAIVREMRAGHEKALAMLAKAKDGLNDPEAQKLLSETLSTIQSHLDQAKRLERPTE
jgi:putative membrane protein